MEITKVVKNAIKNPNDATLNSLPEYAQGLIYTVTTYCIDNNKGKVEKATKINKLIIPIIKNRLSARADKNVIPPIIKPVENIFSKLINKHDWECETCMLNNDKDSSKCISCGTLKPGNKDSALKDGPVKPKQGITLVEKYVKKPTQSQNIEQPTYAEEKEYDKRGVLSVITAFRLLKKLNYKRTTSVDIYINNSSSSAIRVYYNSVPGLDKMFAVYEGYNSLGVDKELMLWGQELKAYINEIFSRKNKSGTFQFKITKIDININNNIKRFYIDSLGIIWNNEDCAECHLKQLSGLELNPKCKTLIDNKCADNFRYRPTDGKKKTFLEIPDVPSPEVVIPEVPSPEVPSPEVVIPEVPSPEVPSPDVPSPEVPSPEVPSPELPSPEVVIPQVPSPDLPSPQVPSPDVPSPEVPTEAPKDEVVKSYTKRRESRPTSDDEERKEIHKGYTEYDERGFRSAIMSFVMLKEENIRKNMCVLVHFNNSQSPGIKVYFDIDTSFRESMYFVYQSYKPLGIDSEHNLYGEDLIKYMEEILLTKNNSGSFKFKITKINITMYNEINRFYIDSLGIVWNHEECADCHIKKLTGLELNPRCDTLIKNKCSDNFTNTPKVIPKVIPKVTPKVIPKVVSESKQSTNKKSSQIKTDQRGVNSIIIVCKEVLPKNPQSTVEVYINDISTPEFKITYSSTSDTQTHANGTYKIVNSRDSEINSLRFEPLKQYIYTIFDKNSKKVYIVSKINLSLPTGDDKRFYIESLGIVWNGDDCTDCVLQERNGEELSNNCKKLLKDKCQDKFKYRKLD